MTVTVKDAVGSMAEARQKYRDGLIPLGEYLCVVDQFLDPQASPEVDPQAPLEVDPQAPLEVEYKEGAHR